MEADFSPRPHAEAVALLAGKPVVTKRVFNQLLPEIKARAFTVSGIESANALQRIRDAVASVPLGATGGQTWDEAKRSIVDELEPYLGEGADYRATLVLRTNGFQAFSSSIHEVGMQDEDTTHCQYLHGECEAPTPSHLALNGVVLPKDDPFWETHTGPWGHLGCVCYKRPLNEDFVADEKEKDAQRNPDERNVIEGPALKQIHHGDIIRAGRHYNLDVDGPDNSGFQWSPGDFKIPLADLEKKYDPAVWSEFQKWAQGQPLNGQQSVWDWLVSSGPKSTVAAPIPAVTATSAATAPAKTLAEAVARMQKDFGVSSVEIAAPSHPKIWGAKMGSDKARLAHLNKLAAAWADLKNRFPDMPKAPLSRLLLVKSKRGRAHLDKIHGSDNFMATKTEEWSDESFKTIGEWEKLHGRKWGSERQGTQVEDNFRHEFGHVLTDSETLDEWRKLTAKKGWDSTWFKNNVTEYAGQDIYEQIADTFGICTRPDYKLGTLPIELEHFVFRRMLGMK